MKIADICNFVVDCLNGWDETAEQCVSEVQRQMFVVDGKLSKITPHAEIVHIRTALMEY